MAMLHLLKKIFIINHLLKLNKKMFFIRLYLIDSKNDKIWNDLRKSERKVGEFFLYRIRKIYGSRQNKFFINE